MSSTPVTVPLVPQGGACMSSILSVPHGTRRDIERGYVRRFLLKEIYCSSPEPPFGDLNALLPGRFFSRIFLLTLVFVTNKAEGEQPAAHGVLWIINLTLLGTDSLLFFCRFTELRY